ncbi:asparagine synthase-related protein [Polaribacter sp. Asnod1-A03]|uniref:asparagine synthase-related protein n=1 Tax=Polaribacter sp. Asnod1-A03 TaxID=3160581 RepID=UPI00386BDC8F
MKITLNHSKGFKWHTNNTLYFKGYFYVDAVFFEEEDAFNYLLKIKHSKEFKTILNSLDGVFTFIIIIEESYYIVSDLTRSFPIFYTFQNNELFISDDIYYLKNTFKINNFDPLSEIEFITSNHTHGKKTLLKNVYQVQASEYLIVKKEIIIHRNFFYSYAIKKEKPGSYSVLKSKAIIAFENSFNRFINSLNNKTAVVPLSGGFDSRLIAVMLKKHHYKDVICYTYGRKDSFEIENSKKTAETLGFKWFFIEYKPQLIEGFLETNEFKKYVHFSGKLSSMPNLQEYFAIKFLSENQLIPKDSILIPGYAGDILGGSEFANKIPVNLESKQIASLILNKKLTNKVHSKKNKKTLKKEIEKNLLFFDSNFSKKIPETVYEDYNIKERIAKYIFNSANFYTFFNYEFRFPFWDQQLLDFFKTTPIKYKKTKMLFDDVLIHEYFKPYQVYFETELQPSKKTIYTQKIKNKIKPFLPTFIKQKILQKNDWNNYKPLIDEITKKLNTKGLKISKSSKDYNEIITQWYIYYSKNMTP